MNKARIEELVEQVFREWANEAAVKKALTTLAKECFEAAAKECDRQAQEIQGECERNYKSDDFSLRCAANAIRALAEEVGK